MIWVLDASVAAKWFFADEARRAQAVAVRAALVAGPELFVVPHLFFSETAHLLGRRSGRDRAFCAKGMGLLLRLGLRTLGLSEGGWRRVAHGVASGLTGYDATYVALARELGGRWITDDTKAAELIGERWACRLADWAGS